ncbi:hypothetical protein PSN45_003139 [Yamadazyma tenuis]|nr:hypothetical protein PSN45_003139 [Yamadazyma tenuis]
MDSCGPSNAVKNLAQYSSRDTSLQNDVARGRGPMGPQSFRNTNVVDNNLNQQFQEFSGAPTTNFASQFMNQFNPGTIQRPGPPSQLPQAQQQGWVNDFSHMSLEQRQHQHHQQQHHQQHQQHHQQHQQQQYQQDWHSQFNSQTRSQPSQLSPNYTSFQLNTRSNLRTHFEPIAANMTEHRETHHLEQQNQQFEQHFQDIEKELAADTSDKQEFAMAAKSIHTTLSSQGSRNNEMADKLKNSEFMKLMDSISHRRVELSTQGDKLVDQQGNDVRDVALAHDREETVTHDRISINEPSTTSHANPILTGNPMMHYHDYPHTEQQVADPSQNSHLPDPLAHIPDGSLEGISEPLQAARIISGNQVKARNWMEDDDFLDMTDGMNQVSTSLDRMRQQEYEAYRHDDDYQ